MSSTLWAGASVGADLSELREMHERAWHATFADREWQTSMLGPRAAAASASTAVAPAAVPAAPAIAPAPARPAWRPVAPKPHAQPIQPSASATDTEEVTTDGGGSSVDVVVAGDGGSAVCTSEVREKVTTRVMKGSGRPRGGGTDGEDTGSEEGGVEDDGSGRPRKIIKRHRMTKEEEARFTPEQLRDLQGTTAAKSRKMTNTEHDVMLHKRRLRNRASAARSREKQRKTIGDLSTEVDALVSTVAHLNARAAAAEAHSAVITRQNAELAQALVGLRSDAALLRKQIASGAQVAATEASTASAPVFGPVVEGEARSGCRPPLGKSAAPPPSGMKRVASSLRKNLSSGELFANAGSVALAAVTSAQNLAGMAMSGVPSQLAQSPARLPNSSSGLLSVFPSRSFSTLPFNMSSDNLLGTGLLGGGGGGVAPIASMPSTSSALLAASGQGQGLQRNFSFFDRLFDTNQTGGMSRLPSANFLPPQ